MRSNFINDSHFDEEFYIKTMPYMEVKSLKINGENLIDIYNDNAEMGQKDLVHEYGVKVALEIKRLYN